MSDDMIQDDVMEMLPEFLQESEEHLQVLNEKMLDAEKAIKAGAQMDAKELNTMFRSAHTIKGTASFIGLKKVVGLTHKAETLLQKLRDGEMQLTAAAVEALFASFDKLNSLLKVLRETKTEGVEISDEVHKIEMVLNPGGVPVAAPVAAPPKPAAPPPPPPPPKKEEAATSADEAGVNEKYLEQFVTEVEQNIDDLNNLLLKTEQEEGNTQVVHDIFRIMHTIKGSSGIVNAKPIAEVAHKMENILQFFRAQNRPIPPDMASVLFKGLDAIKSMIVQLRKTRMIDFDVTTVCKALDKSSIKIVLEMKVAAAGAAKAAAPKAVTPVQDVVVDWTQLPADKRAMVKAEVAQGKDIFVIEATVAAKENIKSMRLMMVEGRLDKNGKAIVSFPTAEALDATKIEAMICVLFASNVNEGNVREILAMDGLVIKTVEKVDAAFLATIIGDKPMEKVNMTDLSAAQTSRPEAAAAVKDEPAAAAIKAPDAKGGAPIEISTVKIDARKLDKLMNLSGELVIIRSQYARLVGLFNNDLLRQKDVVRVVDHSTTLLTDLQKELTATVAGGKNDLSRVQKMVEELKTSIQMLFTQVNQEDIVDNIHKLAETTGSLEKTASDLQAGVMQTRMVPVEGVFTRFKRIVRDISKDLDKDVVLHIEGAETELDKKIVDGLGDPLTHMIRNAVDHGIEDRATREKNGKPAIGMVVLKASHKGNSMCIEIRDDGKGMDADKIAASAVKKGVITEEQALKMTEKEKLNLIFLPGFSMAAKVTGLSGRGVGMDVVKSMITSFNGVVDIDTKVGVGSKFILKIPLTLAIIQALLVIIGGEVYALPIDAVTEIIKVPTKDIYSVDGNSTVKLRNHALSLVELEKVIKVKANASQEEEYKRVVIITDGENRLGVLVDSLVGKDEIVIKSFTRHFSRVKGVIGASILADGNVALILDPGTIIKESR
ncbi:MAG: Hpt domain-containing protein [Candidatus Omnitrophica bacterium]|nr:Hpt domain-containing protein [Candidatus Omnitrophota bacterium]